VNGNSKQKQKQNDTENTLSHPQLHSQPLQPGSPVRSFLPFGTFVKETSSGLQIHVPGTVAAEGDGGGEVVHYHRAGSSIGTDEEAEGREVIDVIITGEVSLDTLSARAFLLDFFPSIFFLLVFR
jgi:hypothetical protein